MSSVSTSKLNAISSDASGVERVLAAIDRHDKVAILFSGPGCRSCSVVKRGLRLNGVVFEADVVQNADLADAYSISRTPTLVLLNRDGVVDRLTSSDPDEMNRLCRRNA